MIWQTLLVHNHPLIHLQDFNHVFVYGVLISKTPSRLNKNTISSVVVSFWKCKPKTQIRNEGGHFPKPHVCGTLHMSPGTASASQQKGPLGCPPGPVLSPPWRAVSGSALTQRCSVLSIVRGWSPAHPRSHRCPAQLQDSRPPEPPSSKQPGPLRKTDSSHFRSGFYKNIKQGRSYAWVQNILFSKLLFQK